MYTKGIVTFGAAGMYFPHDISYFFVVVITHLYIDPVVVLFFVVTFLSGLVLT